jgi:hypothetical protein
MNQKNYIKEMNANPVKFWKHCVNLKNLVQIIAKYCFFSMKKTAFDFNNCYHRKLVVK